MRMITAQFISLSAAFILDFILGDPDFAFHPIRLIGRLISALEKLLRGIFPKSKNGELISGAVMAVLVVVISGAVTAAVLFVLYRLNFIAGIIGEAIICYFMLAAKSLKQSSMKVYSALKSGNLEKSRQAVSMIVGRDTENLSEEGVIKAAVETVAENTSDGVIAPLFYMLLFGAAGGVVYKSINTMDSMVGYKNDKYIDFGKFAARLDDIVNFIPSRLSAAVMILSAAVIKMDFKNAVKIYRRDRKKHASPNSAQTEAVCAGALDIELAGDAYYFGELHKKPHIGDDLRDIEADDIRRANALMYTTTFLTFGIGSIIKIIIWVVI